MDDIQQCVFEVLEELGLLKATYLELEVRLFRSLYRLVAKDTPQYQKLFPRSKVTSLPDDLHAIMHSSWESHSVYTATSSSSHAHSGRNCSAQFKPGEPIYRCLDCGYDATCVLCVHCFNKEDHIGHRIVSDICSPANTGICDCGDPEAWTKELHCKAELEKPSSSGYKLEDEALPDRLETIYKELLVYILEVFSHQYQTLPVIREFFASQSDADVGETLANCYEAFAQGPVLRDEEFELYFWNDEFHNFDQARNGIKSAADVSHDRAVGFADEIDRVGRCKIKSDKNRSRLIYGLKDSIRTKFTASIISKSEILRQTLVLIIIRWISNTIKHPNPEFQEIARKSFCKVLCSDLNPAYLTNAYFDGARTNPDQLTGLLYNGHLPSLNTEGEKFRKSSTYLQYLLFFDIRFWKQLRNSIHSLIIPTLVSDLHYKRVSSKQIVEIYPLLLRSFSALDREPHLNIMMEISTQFFTCPTNTTDIVTTSFNNVLRPILHVMLKFVNERDIFILPNADNDLSQSKVGAIKRSLQDLYYIVDKSLTLDQVFTEEVNFNNLNIIFGILSRASKIKRKVGAHVESESFEFLNYLNIWYLILHVIVGVTDPTKFQDHPEDFFLKPLKHLISSLDIYAPKFKTLKNHKVIDFVVSNESESILNPKLTFLSVLLPLYAKSTKMIKDLFEGVDVLEFSDYSLRSIVMTAQIDSQFWIRNGQSAPTHSASYKGPMLWRLSPYVQDLHLVQVSLLTTDPVRSLYNIIDRFELTEWFINNRDLDSTFYEDKIPSLIEKFISFLYGLLTFRDGFMEFQTNEEIFTRNYEILLIFNLFSGPRGYSDLEILVEDNDHDKPAIFDRILKKVSKFEPPKGLNDEGKYSLKPEYLKRIDPLNISGQFLDFNKAITSLSKSLLTNSEDGTSWEDVIIPPLITKLENFPELGQFTRTPEFAKLLSKLLVYVVDKEKDSFAPVLLHLIHAVIIDNEQVNGKAHILESFYQFPICENLFSIISNSNFSKQLRSKADHILSSLIIKDPEDLLASLVACFGNEQVEQYKEKKKNSGLNFDETEVEKKRRLAKERQKKILDRMKKKQKKFLDKNDSTQSAGSKGSSEDVSTDANTCVLCQGPGTIKDFLCSPLSITTTDTFRVITNEIFFFNRAFCNWGDDSVENPLKDAEGLIQPQYYKGISVRVGTSCNHLVHFKCLKNYHNNSSKYQDVSCPLCKTKHDTYIPAVGKISDISDESIQDTGVDKIDLFFNSLFKEERPKVLDYKEILNVNFLHFQAGGDDAKITMLMGALLSNSIKQAEISTRINGTDSYVKFLDLIPEQTYKTFRTLLKYFVVLEKLVISGLTKRILNTFKTNGGFMINFVFQYLLGSKSFHRLSVDWIKYFIEVYTNIFLTIHINVHEETVGDLAIDHDTDPEEAILFEKMVQKLNIKGNFDPSVMEKMKDPEIAKGYIQRIKAVLLPDIRNLAIFYKVLRPDFSLDFPDGENFTINSLLRAIGLPSFIEILRSPNAFVAENAAIDLPYPGVVKLVDLPVDLSYFSTTDTFTSEQDPLIDHRFIKSERVKGELNNRIDYAICLVCGTKFLNRGRQELVEHNHKFGDKTSYCSGAGGVIYFFPSSSSISMLMDRNSQVLNKRMNAPYLNEHGQSGHKAIHNGHSATLNYTRYKHLNNLWLTGGIYPYLTRHATPRANRGDLFTNIFDRVLNQAVPNMEITQETLANFFDNETDLVNDINRRGTDDFSEFNQLIEDLESEDYISENDQDYQDEFENEDDDIDEVDDVDDVDDNSDEDDDDDDPHFHENYRNFINGLDPTNFTGTFLESLRNAVNGHDEDDDEDYMDHDDEDDEDDDDEEDDDDDEEHDHHHAGGNSQPGHPSDSYAQFEMQFPEDQRISSLDIQLYLLNNPHIASMFGLDLDEGNYEYGEDFPSVLGMRRGELNYPIGNESEEEESDDYEAYRQAYRHEMFPNAWGDEDQYPGYDSDESPFYHHQWVETSNNDDSSVDGSAYTDAHNNLESDDDNNDEFEIQSVD